LIESNCLVQLPRPAAAIAASATSSLFILVIVLDFNVLN
jgi:hypothetical protein